MPRHAPYQAPILSNLSETVQARGISRHDPEVYRFTRDVAGKLFGQGAYADLVPTMGAEDFSVYGALVPSTFTFLGTGNATLGTDVGVHNPYFKLDESVLPRGAAYHSALVLASIGKAARYAQRHEL